MASERRSNLKFKKLVEDSKPLGQLRPGKLVVVGSPSIARLCFIILLLSACAFSIRPIPEFVPWGVGFLSVAIAASVFLSVRTGLFCLGALALVLPMFRNGALEVGLLFFVAALEVGRRVSIREASPRVVLVFQLILLALAPGLVKGIGQSFDWLLFQSVLDQGGFYGLYRWVD